MQFVLNLPTFTHQNMSIEKRRFIRFSLDIPAYCFSKEGDLSEIIIRQVSIGGCLAETDEPILIGEEFRMEMVLPNKNHLPIYGKAVYDYPGKGVGIKFQNITQFEQSLVGLIISKSLEVEGLPLLVDPFLQPPNFAKNISSKTTSSRTERLAADEKLAESIAD